jgi:hypothetical protein
LFFELSLSLTHSLEMRRRKKRSREHLSNVVLFLRAKHD